MVLTVEGAASDAYICTRYIHVPDDKQFPKGFVLGLRFISRFRVIFGSLTVIDCLNRSGRVFIEVW